MSLTVLAQQNPQTQLWQQPWFWVVVAAIGILLFWFVVLPRIPAIVYGIRDPWYKFLHGGLGPEQGSLEEIERTYREERRKAVNAARRSRVLRHGVTLTQRRIEDDTRADGDDVNWRGLIAFRSSPQTTPVGSPPPMPPTGLNP